MREAAAKEVAAAFKQERGRSSRRHLPDTYRTKTEEFHSFEQELVSSESSEDLLEQQNSASRLEGSSECRQEASGDSAASKLAPTKLVDCLVIDHSHCCCCCCCYSSLEIEVHQQLSVECKRCSAGNARRRARDANSKRVILLVLLALLVGGLIIVGLHLFVRCILFNAKSQNEGNYTHGGAGDALNGQRALKPHPLLANGTADVSAVLALAAAAAATARRTGKTDPDYFLHSLRQNQQQLQKQRLEEEEKSGKRVRIGTRLKRHSNNKNQQSQLKLSHHVVCEPISQLFDLKLNCALENQFIVVLEAYYSDLYPELVCSRAANEAKLHKLTGSQLRTIFRQLYSQNSPVATAPTRPLVQFNPTLAYGSQRPFCLDDLKQDFAAKCSGRQRCRFSRSKDHQFPACAQLKPGHVFARYLCVDDALLLRYCNANTRLASHSSALSRVRRQFLDDVPNDGVAAADDDENDEQPQLDTFDFGFVASPGYPNFYATPTAAAATSHGQPSECGWTIEAEVGQYVTVKLLDASLAPQKQTRQLLSDFDYTTSSSLLPYFGHTESDLARGGNMISRQHSELLPARANVTSFESGDSGGAVKQANVQFETVETSYKIANTGNLKYESFLFAPTNKRIVFKIDRHDLEVLKLSLGEKLKQVAEQCQGYDQLILRDPPRKQTATSVFGSGQSDTLGADELTLISKLPIVLYKNRLIDFDNQTIYHKLISTNSDKFGTAEQNTKRIDYQALIDNLNPLQLVWLYQRNITLCSIGQQDDLSAPLHKNRISFTSSANSIKLDLVSGQKFNPTSRGVFFWYDKQGCPSTRRAPNRSRLVFQNETTEIFQCLEGFVFSDTRQSVRIRYCSHDSQTWQDSPDERQPRGHSAIPSCVYVEELTMLSNNLLASQQNSIKFDRLVAAPAVENSPSSQAQLSPAISANNNHPVRVISNSNDVAVEVVGLPEAPTANRLMDDVELIHQTNLQQQQQHYPPANANSYDLRQRRLLPTSFWQNMLDYTSQTETKDLTHQRVRGEPNLIDKKSENYQDRSIWTQIIALFDRRLLAPAIAVLFLFIILNIMIYEIFLVALPKLGRICCSSPRRTRPVSRTSSNNFYQGASTTTLTHADEVTQMIETKRKRTLMLLRAKEAPKASFELISPTDQEVPNITDGFLAPNEDKLDDGSSGGGSFA